MALSRKNKKRPATRINLSPDNEDDEIEQNEDDKIEKQVIGEQQEEEVQEDKQVEKPKIIKKVSNSSNSSAWSLTEIPTQTEVSIYNKKTNKYYTIHEGIVEILNKLEEL